jgi:NAD(P)H-dependent flavin oxidoreductase YrpB (nitropropane dioxygenase family)
MKIETSLTRMLDIEVPICQAGMGTIAYHELAAAVSAAGGLGAFGGIDMSVEELDEGLAAARKLTDRPLCVDLGFPQRAPARVEDVQTPTPEPIRQLERELTDKGVRIEPVPEQAISKEDAERKLEVVLDHRVEVLACALGTPEWAVERSHAAGTKVMSIVGRARQARRALANGADMIVVQGYEGGGHTGDVGLMTLLTEVLEFAEDAPVIAAGGISRGSQIAGLLVAGASGVWVGTRFVATQESRAEEGFKRKIVESASDGTIRSLLADGLYHRQLRNRATEVWEGREDEILPYPAQRVANAAVRRAAHKAGLEEYMTLGAGQGSVMVRDIPPAAEVLRALTDETLTALRSGFETLLSKA